MIIASAIGLYLLTGLLFAIAFVAAGIHRVDVNARGSGVVFRITMGPGSIVLWPLLMVRWLRTRS